jgi:hypothetical protein
MQPEAPWRKVVGRESYTTSSHSRGTYSVALTLECGHQKHYKGSREPRSGRVRCPQCARDEALNAVDAFVYSRMNETST